MFDKLRMFQRFTPASREVILAANREATEIRRDRHIGTEHLLIGIVESGTWPVRDLLETQQLRDGLAAMDEAALASVGIAADLTTGGIRSAMRARRHTPFTSGVKRRLERSLEVAYEYQHRHIEPNHILVAITTADERDPAIRLLDSIGVAAADITAAARDALYDPPG